MSKSEIIKEDDKHMDKSKEKSEGLVKTMGGEQVVQQEETIALFEGAIRVPKEQRFRHLNMEKKHYYSVNNPKFSSLIANPVISEKSMAICANGYYTFKVDKKATKRQITHAIEKIFGIAVVEIKTIRTGSMVSRWSHKKKKNLKEGIGKKALIKFNPEVEIDMERVQNIMQNRTNIMER